MRRRVRNVFTSNGSRACAPARYADADRDARAFDDEWREPARRSAERCNMKDWLGAPST